MHLEEADERPLEVEHVGVVGGVEVGGQHLAAAPARVEDGARPLVPQRRQRRVLCVGVLAAAQQLRRLQLHRHSVTHVAVRRRGGGDSTLALD